MSGEPLVLLPGTAMVRLVRAAAKIADAKLGRYAIIGGLAVSARLGKPTAPPPTSTPSSMI